MEFKFRLNNALYNILHTKLHINMNYARFKIKDEI